MAKPSVFLRSTQEFAFIIKLKRKRCSANTSHVDLKTTHFTNIARVGRWMVKIWSFSFLSLKLKIKQFRELGMTCEWMRWHWNYEVKSLSFRVAMSVLSILPHFSNTENLSTRLFYKTSTPAWTRNTSEKMSFRVVSSKFKICNFFFCFRALCF